MGAFTLRANLQFLSNKLEMLEYLYHIDRKNNSKAICVYQVLHLNILICDLTLIQRHLDSKFLSTVLFKVWFLEILLIFKVLYRCHVEVVDAVFHYSQRTYTVCTSNALFNAT